MMNTSKRKHDWRNFTMNGNAQRWLQHRRSAREIPWLTRYDANTTSLVTIIALRCNPASGECLNLAGVSVRTSVRLFSRRNNHLENHLKAAGKTKTLLALAFA